MSVAATISNVAPPTKLCKPFRTVFAFSLEIRFFEATQARLRLKPSLGIGQSLPRTFTIVI